METRTRKNLAPAIRASLNAKLERLLDRPIIARIATPAHEAEDAEDAEVNDLPGIFRALQLAARAFTPVTRRISPWLEDPKDGTCSVRVELDYDDLWRGKEKEILDAVLGMVESFVTFLTDEQRKLLERSPREFLALNPRPETEELVSFETENVGGSVRVVALRVSAAPESRAHLRHVAIVPNLVQLERQLDALRVIEAAGDDGPLAPLRTLVGLCDPTCLMPPSGDESVAAAPDEHLDEHQIECIRKAMTTPHYSVIQGPPGSGKTTVITGIIRRALGRGDRVLVVSPTHVAVDNVVEKLAPRKDSKLEDLLEERSLPVRFAARTKKLSERAREYWVGSKRQLRGAAIARRVQRRLTEVIPFASALFAMEDKEASGHAPLSGAVARVEPVICGTPIGILSFDSVKNAAPGSFGFLVVDEVSKMTLPEFLAIAVKARRWVLVGDPEQLPPFNNGEENATTLDDVLDPPMELACSVGAIMERARPADRRNERLVVISSDPDRAARGIRAHLDSFKLDNLPRVARLDQAPDHGIVVCSPEDCERACELLSPTRGTDRGHNPESSGSVRILVERGISLARPGYASGARLVEPRVRAQALIFENSFNTYHAQPWSNRSGQKLLVVTFRNGLDKDLPSAAALESLTDHTESGLSPIEGRAALIEAIAERYAVNTISVYDWLTGIPTAHFDVSPLQDLEALSPVDLCRAVRPFVGTLKKQYRMHSSLSRVPRDLFYFGEALHDGRSDARPGCRVNLLQVVPKGEEGESNTREVQTICDLLERLNADAVAGQQRAGIMVITPYRKQEARLAEAIEVLRSRGTVGQLDIEVCTLDRCQGREAEYVFISLVRSRATPFMDMPKRWNVALTRGMEGLFIVGNIDAYVEEARRARSHPRAQPESRRDPIAQRGATNGTAPSGQPRPMMSLLARIIEAYERQILDAQTGKNRLSKEDKLCG